MNKKSVPLVTLLVIGGMIIGFVLGYTINVDRQVEREVNFRLERMLSNEEYPNK